MRGWGGFSTRQIAEQLHIGFKTAQTFRTRIKEKLKLANATELLREAIRWHDREGSNDTAVPRKPGE